MEDTYIHSDVNYPLWHCLIEKHRLSLAPGIPAEQPRHNPSGSQCHDKQGDNRRGTLTVLTEDSKVTAEQGVPGHHRTHSAEGPASAMGHGMDFAHSEGSSVAATLRALAKEGSLHSGKADVSSHLTLV